MGTQTKPADGALTLAEMKEFASFSKGTQRYIRRSLDVGLGRRDAIKRWSRDVAEAASIRAQARIYQRLDHIRSEEHTSELHSLMRITSSAFCFEQKTNLTTHYDSFHFIYRRLHIIQIPT